MNNVLTITEEVKNFLIMNASTESYRNLPGEYKSRNGKWRMWIDFDKIKPYQIEAAQKDLDILKSRIELFDKRTGPRVGDYLELPYGILTRFTHAWDDGIQIGGGSSSYYLGNGYISYSGGLDPSIEYSAIVPTDKKKDGVIWFFHGDSAGGGRGVYSTIPFRVFKLADWYDSSTIWMVRDEERRLYREKAEKITRTNGNGQQYTLPVPEIHLQNVTKEQVEEIQKISGLVFEPMAFNCFRCQPLKISETLAVTSYPYWDGTYYNNGTYKNTLYLKYKKEGRSNMPSLLQ